MHGLANGVPHHIAFRLALDTFSHPKGDSVILLPGTPKAGAAFPEQVQQALAASALAAASAAAEPERGQGREQQEGGECSSSVSCVCVCLSLHCAMSRKRN